MENLFDTSKSVLQKINVNQREFRNVQLFVKRDDLIHSEVSGNKWRKLKYNLLQAKHLKKEGILTFGGAFSNHLLAVASACHRAGLRSIGIVRGDELTESSNHNLMRCTELGMDLHFIERSLYQLRNEWDFQNELKASYPSYFLVPEGGANYYGLNGCMELWNEISESFDFVFVAQGTSNTSAGLLLGMPEKTTMHVVPVLKGYDSNAEMRRQLAFFTTDKEEIDALLARVHVHENAHGGGYGKWDNALEVFIEDCRLNYNLPLDRIYTGKAFKALLDWLSESKFEQETRILFLHTGGLMNG